MKYLVISTRKNETFMPMTVCAEVSNLNLAQRLMEHYNATDKGQMAEVHPVMEDAEVINMLNKFNKE